MISSYKRKRKSQQILLYSCYYPGRMGGNAFEDTQKLTPAEYTAIMAKIRSLLQPICQVIEPYIPLPEKQLHGDIDFFIILKNGYQMQDIRTILQIDEAHFIANNNDTANSVYMKKQVDFNVVKDQHQFQLCNFYKSYGGIGAFLGLFLPSKFVKFSEEGLFCCAYQQHIKLQYLVCDDVSQILSFYGLDYEQYEKGFTTRLQLFQYLRDIRFLDEIRFISHTTKHQTKLMIAFQEYLIVKGPKVNTRYVQFKQPCEKTLIQFDKFDEFRIQWKNRLEEEATKKKRNQKWNGMHIMTVFLVSSKNVNAYKKVFEASFKDKTQYQNYIDVTPFEQIVHRFSEICEIQPIV